jgi:uncharacterized protein (TIGR00251 family)
VADGRLRVKVGAPALEGRANRELCRFIARELGVPRTRVQVTAGETSRRKTVLIAGLGVAEARLRLGLDEGSP